ncbi:MAG: 30S ribosomal protein S27ae [archaeon]|nr:30S ribosomal protein S27ae [archaeon]
MADKKKPGKQKKAEFYTISGDTVKRAKKTCPKCGAAVFMAEHKDRFGCGKCAYTEWKTGGK